MLLALRHLSAKDDHTAFASANGVEVAKEKNMITIAFTGSTGGKLKNLADHLINIPSDDTPRIQESHITLGHIICQLVEEIYFADTND